IAFDPTIVTYRELLEVFFTLHDPTTLNQQGPDRGTQYRSAIFYHSAEQRAVAEQVIKELEVGQVADDPIVTELVPVPAFPPAALRDHLSEGRPLRGVFAESRLRVRDAGAPARAGGRDLPRGDGRARGERPRHVPDVLGGAPVWRARLVSQRGRPRGGVRQSATGRASPRGLPLGTPRHAASRGGSCLAPDAAAVT